MNKSNILKDIKDYFAHRYSQVETAAKSQGQGPLSGLTNIFGLGEPKKDPLGEERTPEVNPPEGWAYVGSSKAWKSFPSFDLRNIIGKKVDITDPNVGLGKSLILIYDKKSKGYFLATKQSDSLVQVIANPKGDIPVDASPSGAISKFFSLLGSSLGYKKEEKQESNAKEEEKQLKDKIDIAKKLVDLEKKLQSIEGEEEEVVRPPEEEPASEQAKEDQELSKTPSKNLGPEQEKEEAVSPKVPEKEKEERQTSPKKFRDIFEAIAFDYRPALNTIRDFISQTEKREQEALEAGNESVAYKEKINKEDAIRVLKRLSEEISDPISGKLAGTVRFKIKAGNPLKQMLEEAYGFSSRRLPPEKLEHSERRKKIDLVTDQLKQVYHIRVPIYGPQRISSFSDIPDEKIRAEIDSFIKNLRPEDLSKIGAKLVSEANKYNPYYLPKIHRDNIPNYKPYSRILQPIVELFEQGKTITEKDMQNIKDILTEAALDSQSSRYIIHSLATS